MTVQEFYDWALRNGVTDTKLKINYAENAPAYMPDKSDLQGNENEVTIYLP